jgi:hypothetical protein
MRKPLLRFGVRLGGTMLLFLGLVVLLLPCSAAPAPERKDDEKEIKQAANDLKQLLLAMHNCNDTYGRLPSAGHGALVFPGQPALPENHLSWRVFLLPFIEEAPLDNDIHNGKYGTPDVKDAKKLAAFWDNADLLKKRPKLYAGGKGAGETKTMWRVVVGKGAAFENEQLLHFSPRHFPDGYSNTILIVEAAEAVPWTKPDELLYDPDKPLPKLGGRFRTGFLAGMADGTVRLIPYNTLEKVLRALITRNGGENIDKLPGREIE